VHCNGVARSVAGALDYDAVNVRSRAFAIAAPISLRKSSMV
jgi:hypothetical protein